MHCLQNCDKSSRSNHKNYLVPSSSNTSILVQKRHTTKLLRLTVRQRLNVCSKCANNFHRTRILCSTAEVCPSVLAILSADSLLTPNCRCRRTHRCVAQTKQTTKPIAKRSVPSASRIQRVKYSSALFFLFTLLFIVAFESFPPSTDASDSDSFPFSHHLPKKKLKEQDIIQRILRDYDWRVRPRGLNDSWVDTGGPVLVSVNIYMRSISKIDDVNMEYSTQFTFREEWYDARLAYERFADENTHIPPFVVMATSEQLDLSQQIWMPDTFFQNEKEARRHLIDKPNVLIRIHPNGHILYSVRLSLVLSCPMSLEYYPLDRQTCLIDLASYAYTTDDIKYEWKKEKPIQQKEGLRQSLPSFELQDVLTDYCTSKTNTGEYSCLRTKLILRREFSYYLLQLYIPSCMLVIVSWVSFWLDKDSVPARVTLGVTTLLTMTTQSSGINSKLPPVSYTKAVDVWIGVCMAFIFGALLEFALVNYAARKDISTSQQRMLKMHQQYNIQHHQQRRPSAITAEVDESGAVGDGYNLQRAPPLATDPLLSPALQQKQQRRSAGGSFGNAAMAASAASQIRYKGSLSHSKSSDLCYRLCCRLFVRRYKERSKRIDVVSRLVFPIGYACFNVLYWAVYLL